MSVLQPACPVQKNAGCSETKYAKTWAADKFKAKSGYPLTTVAAIQADMVARGPVRWVRSERGTGEDVGSEPRGTQPRGAICEGMGREDLVSVCGVGHVTVGERLGWAG